MAFAERLPVGADWPLCCGLIRETVALLSPLLCCQQVWQWESGVLCPCLQQDGAKKKPFFKPVPHSLPPWCLYSLSKWYVRTALPSVMVFCVWWHWWALLSRVSFDVPWGGPSKLVWFNCFSLNLHNTPGSWIAHCDCVGTLWNHNQVSSRISIALFGRGVWKNSPNKPVIKPSLVKIC